MRRTLKRIGDLQHLDNGLLDAAFRLAMQAVVNDVVDRPGLEKPRSVTVKIEVRPETDDSGRLTDTVIEAQVATSVPAQRTSATIAHVVGSAKTGVADCLLFNDLAPDDPSQMTLDEASEEGEE